MLQPSPSPMAVGLAFGQEASANKPAVEINSRFPTIPPKGKPQARCILRKWKKEVPNNLRLASSGILLFTHKVGHPVLPPALDYSLPNLQLTKLANRLGRPRNAPPQTPKLLTRHLKPVNRSNRPQDKPVARLLNRLGLGPLTTIWLPQPTTLLLPKLPTLKRFGPNEPLLQQSRFPDPVQVPNLLTSVRLRTTLVHLQLRKVFTGQFIVNIRLVQSFRIIIPTVDRVSFLLISPAIPPPPRDTPKARLKP